MKKNLVRALTVVAPVITLVAGMGMGYTQHSHTNYVHVFENVAIYYTADNGYIVDEDGRRFDIDFKELPDQAVIEVTYDNKGTVTRLDDKPISYVLLDEALEARR